MAAESKEHLLKDLESGDTSSARAPIICLPPFTLLRRKKLLVLILLVPTIYFALIYNGNAPSPLHSDARSRVFDAMQQAAPAINQLAGKLPSMGHHYDDAHFDKEGHLHNALLDTMRVEGTAELAQLKHQLEDGSPKSASTATTVNDLALQANQMTKFDAKDEGVMLLLLALQTKGYTVEDDWRQVYFDRTPLQKGVLSMNTGPSNKFTQLLDKVGLPQPKHVANSTALSPNFSILNDAHQVYSLSRQDWVDKVRPSLGLTVFSKSYCPYSKRAKALLTSLNATFTVYEVDQRPDAHQLQPLLAKLTGHRTFPTILVRDRLLGGSDDLQDLHSLHALKSVLASIDAL